MSQTYVFRTFATISIKVEANSLENAQLMADENLAQLAGWQPVNVKIEADPIELTAPHVSLFEIGNKIDTIDRIIHGRN